MPAAGVHRRWSRAEVRALIDEAPRATPRYAHQVVVRRLLVALDHYLQSAPVGEALASPSDVDLEDESLVQPDVYVLPTAEARRLDVPEWRAAESLLLAIEVLSPSSARHDRFTKRPLYQRHVPEYWIVDIDARSIERWRSGDERPAIVSDALTWTPEGAAEPLTLALDALFDGLVADGDEG